MKAEYINPFIESTVTVFKTMLGCEAKRTGVDLHDTFTPKYDITGLIGLSGGATGDVVISFQKEVGLRATEALTGEAFTEVTEDVIDTVGELTNMIAGSAKASLAQYEMQLALPTVIVGKNHAIRFPSAVRPISVSFHSEWGNFNIEVGLIEVAAEAAV